MKKEKNITSDEALLNSFFAERRQVIADNGFTERVMAALPERKDARVAEAMRLRRWSQWLNIFAIVAILALLIGLGFFGSVWEYLQAGAVQIVLSIMHYDYDGLLVQTMLFLHRLPGMLPSATQLVAIVASLMILTALSVKKMASQQF